MWLGTQAVNADGHLEIGGCDAVALAERFGTPLYVLDEDALRARCREYRAAFETLKPDTAIVYAGKAALNKAICQIIAEEGLGLDVASGGELYTALQAGFPRERIHLHGVYKTDVELQMALQAGVGAIVIDNFEEIERLQKLITGATAGMPSPPTPSGATAFPPSPPTPSGATAGMPSPPTPSGATAGMPSPPTPSGATAGMPSPPTPSGATAGMPSHPTPSGATAGMPSPPTPSGATAFPPSPPTPSGATAGMPSHRVPVLIRIAPEVDAETHPLIRTGQRDSKFGFHLLNGDAYRAVEAVLNLPMLELKGFHCHIGSQIGDLSAFAAAAGAMVEFADAVRQRYGYVAPLLNIGGGLAVRYTPDDQPPSVQAYAETLVNALREACQRYNYPEPTLGIEPGRSLIAEAGITLYRVGAVKTIPHENPNLPREYLIVDGGVSDNPRPQMYSARYTARHAARAAEPHTHPYRIVGKHCETDPVIDCAHMPETRAGDVIAVLTTGAYAYSMSSNYNRYPRPAMVAVRGGEARVIVERETYDDVLRVDR